MNVPHEEIARAAAHWACFRVFVAVVSIIMFSFGTICACVELPRCKRSNALKAALVAVLFALLAWCISSVRSCIRIECMPSSVTERDLP